jgi:prepilin-type N-terminal cleavage/methylation domain-containing protein
MRALKARGETRGLLGTDTTESHPFVGGSSPRKTQTVPAKAMQNDQAQLRGVVRLKGFTLLELLVVMSIILVLTSILLPCLMRAKQSAYELFAMQTEVDEEGKVLMRIEDPSDRKAYDDIYMIKINPPRNCHVFIKKPHRSGMKLIKRDGQDYIKWRPEWDDIGVHLITVVFEGEEATEQEIKIYVYNKEVLEAEREDKADANVHEEE